MKTTVVVRSSRERNSVRSSLPNKTEVLLSRLMESIAASSLAAASPGASRSIPLSIRERQHGAKIGAALSIRAHHSSVEANRAGSERRNLRLAVQAHDNGATGIAQPAQSFRKPAYAFGVEPG